MTPKEPLGPIRESENPCFVRLQWTLVKPLCLVPKGIRTRPRGRTGGGSQSPVDEGDQSSTVPCLPTGVRGSSPPFVPLAGDKESEEVVSDPSEWVRLSSPPPGLPRPGVPPPLLSKGRQSVSGSLVTQLPSPGPSDLHPIPHPPQRGPVPPNRPPRDRTDDEPDS